MSWVIVTIITFLGTCIVFVSFLFILHKKHSLTFASPATPKKALPDSKTPIDLSMFDTI
jgi:hypothetical protein